MADGSVTVSVKGDVADYKKAVKSLGAEAEKALGQASGSAGGLKGSLDACAVAAGTFIGSIGAQAFSSAISAVGDFAQGVYEVGSAFESSMSNVAALSGATGDQLAQLEETAREFGATTQFSATEAADALGYMALAGWDTQESIDGLPGVLNLAAAAGMGLAQASDMVTDYLSAFGLEAKDSARFADMLAYAQANSNTTAAALGEAYKNCAANLNAAGQDVETVTSLLAMMANQGLKGSEAGTALAAIMRDVTSSMQDGAIQIGDTTVAVTDAQGNFRDLTDILADVEAATAGMGDAERAAALSATFTADSTKGLNLILNAGVGEAAAFEDGLRNCDGAAADMAATMNDNLQGDLKSLSSAFEELQLKCFDAVQPALRGLAGAATDDLIPALTDALFGIEQSVPVYDELGTQVGTTTERTGGLAGALAGLGEAAAPGIEGARTALQGLADYVGPKFDELATAAQGMADTVGGNLSQAFGDLQPAMQAAGDFLGGALSGAFETLCGVAEGVMGGVGDVSGLFATLAEETGPALQTFFEGFDLSSLTAAFQGVADVVGGALGDAFTTINDSLLPALGDAFDAVADHLPEIQGAFDAVSGTLGEVGEMLAGAGGTALNGALEALSGLISTVADLVSGDFDGAWENLTGVFETVGTTLNGMVDTLFPGLVEGIGGVCDTVGETWDGAWEAAGTALDEFGQGVQAAADEAFPGLTDAVGGVVGSLGEGDWGSAWQGAQDAAGAVMDGILAGAQTAFPQTTEVIGGLVSGAQAAFDSWGIAETAQATWDGITSTVGDLAGQAGTAISGFIDDAAGWFGSWGIDDTADDVWDSISSTVDDLSGQAGDAAKGFVDTVSSQFSAWGIDGVTNTIWTSLKGFIDNPIGTLDSSISGFISGVASQFEGWTVADTVNGIFQNVKSFMEDPIGSAQGFISDALGNISSIVTGLDLNLPHFALPHFWVNGGEAPWGIGGYGSPPSFGVDWYARGGVFDGPSVIGVGERGPEAVVPLSSERMRPFAQAIAEELEDAGGLPDTRWVRPDEGAMVAALEGVSAGLTALEEPWRAASAALSRAAAPAAARASAASVTYRCGDVVVQARDAMEAGDFEEFMRDVLRRAGMYEG